MKKTLGLAALTAMLLSGAANAQQVTVKIGVLSDMSSLYADIGGPGSVAAAKLAVAEFTKDNPNVKVELISGDHQNKPDVGSNIANQWLDVDKVDVIVDVPNSGVALAVSQIAATKNKVFVVSGAASSDLTGSKCNANTVHWTYDTWMLSNGTAKAMVKNRLDTINIALNEQTYLDILLWNSSEVGSLVMKDLIDNGPKGEVLKYKSWLGYRW